MTNLQTDPHRAGCDGRWACHFLLSAEPTPKLGSGSDTEAAAKCELHEAREPVDDPTLLRGKTYLCYFNKISNKIQERTILFGLITSTLLIQLALLEHLCHNDLSLCSLSPMDKVNWCDEGMNSPSALNTLWSKSWSFPYWHHYVFTRWSWLQLQSKSKKRKVPSLRCWQGHYLPRQKLGEHVEYNRLLTWTGDMQRETLRKPIEP